MSTGITFRTKLHFRRGRAGRKRVEPGAAPPAPVEHSRVPRISRLMALAIRFEKLVQAGEVADYAELARLGHVTRARVTQIMNLQMLAPDIQEELLFLPRIEEGRDRLHIKLLLPIAATTDWSKQRKLWASLQATNVSIEE
jgi:hypothetical protein